MSKKDKTSRTSSEQVESRTLRRQAEEQVAALDLTTSKVLTPEETHQMLHELRVHQIELKMQNEELQRTQFELITAHQRYFDLYDLAPIGFITISEKGLILEANLTAAGLLGVERGPLVKQPLSHFILKEDQDIYYLHRKLLFERGEAQECDLRMMKKDGTTFWAHLKGTAAQDGEGASFVRAVISDISGRKQSEESLIESEERFRTIANFAVSWESWFGPDGKYIWVNPGVENLTGYSAQEILAMPDFISTVIAAEDHSTFINSFHEAIRGSRVENFEFRYLHKNGTKRWLSASWRPVYDAQGNPLSARSSGHDITERKQAEQALTQQNSALLKLNRFSIELNMLSAEDNLEELIARQIKEISGAEMAIFSKYNPDDRTTTPQQIEMKPELLQKVVRLLGKQVKNVHSVVSDEMYREMTSEIIGERKTLFDVSFGAIPRPIGAAIQALLKVDRFIGIAYLIEEKLFGTSVLGMRKDQPDPSREILENYINLAAMSLRRRQAEHALGKSEDKFKYVFDHASVGKSLTLPTGEISVNQAMCDMLGYSQEEIKKRKWREISHPEDLESTQNEINALLAGEKESARFLKRYLHKNGSVVWTDLSTALRRDKDGQPLYFMTTINDITERVQADEALHASEEKFRTLIEQSTDGIVISDEHGNIDLWNKGVESITGLNACDTIGAPLWKVQAQLIPDEIKTPGLLEQLRTGMENIIQSKIDWQGESREQTIICADGKRKTVQDSTFIIKTNNTVRIGTILHDITERKQAEEKQKENNLKLQLAMQSANMAWWEMDITTGLVTFEKRKAEMLGYAPEKFHHYNDFMALLHPDDNEKAMDAMRKHIDGSLEKYEVEYRILNNSGEYKWFYDIGAIVKRDSKGNPLKVTGLVMDINERRLAQETLTNQYHLLTALINSPHDIIIFSLDREYRYTAFNDSHRAEMKKVWDVDIKRGMNLLEIMTIPELRESAAESIDRVLQGEAFIEIQHQPKKDITCEFSWNPIQRTPGNVVGVTAFIRDITHRVRNENEIRRLNADLERRVAERTAQLAASNKELEAFAYSVSHDLRAPLRAIDGFTKILLEDQIDRLDPEGKRMLSILRANTDKMDGLITGLLALTRTSRSELKLSRIDMASMAHSIYLEMASPEVQEIFTFSVAPLPDAYGDPTLLRQVWSNLISNAIKYSLPKGKGIIQIDGRLEANVCTYAIHDNGVGFNPAYTHKLFGVFQRLHKEEDFEGNGVGLAIVKRIVERLGGEVWAESIRDQGATFSFTLKAWVGVDQEIDSSDGGLT